MENQEKQQKTEEKDPFTKMLDEERQEIFEGEHPDGGYSALCLSGGGIRSATFCLGVIQALAEYKLLGKFCYLSTVSGGGYIGCWLTGWIRREGFAAVTQNLQAPQEPDEVRRLRNYSNYLSPMAGLSQDTFALASIYVRNLLIIWMVLLPLIVAAVLIPLLQTAFVGAVIFGDAPGSVVVKYCFFAAMCLFGLGAFCYDRSHTKRSALSVLLACVALSWAGGYLAADGMGYPWWWFVLLGAVANADAVVARIAEPLWFVLLGTASNAGGVFISRLPNWFLGDGTFGRDAKAIVLALIAGASGGFLVWLGMSYAFAVQADFNWCMREWKLLYSTFAVPYLLAAYSLAMVIFTALARWCAFTDESVREWWGLYGGWLIVFALGWLLAHALALWLPMAVLATFDSPLGAAGSVGGIVGIVTTVIGYFSREGATNTDALKRTLLDKLGIGILEVASLFFMAALIVFISLVVMRLLGDWSVPQIGRAQAWDAWVLSFEHFAGETASRIMRCAALGKLFCALVVALIVALLASWFVKVNTFSLNALYGNRLVRAYLGSTRKPKERQPTTTGFDPDDDIALADCGESDLSPLFHVINTAINLTKKSSQDLAWRDRKADSFTFTPLHAGSKQTGYCATREYAGGNFPPKLVLAGNQSARATGISLGKACSISGAAAAPNMGYHTSRLVAFLMTFFNIRLGWWVPNPKKAETLKQRNSDEPSCTLKALLSELRASSSQNSSSVYLSDGGHFENLGLYEMVRRECTRILIIDASCDPKYEFDDLDRAIRLIRTDLDAEITFENGLPTAESIRKTKCHFACGKIKYKRTNKEGTIVYIKPGLSEAVPADVLRFAEQLRTKGRPFPHESTADQFFSEPQFESYRLLGYHSLKSIKRYLGRKNKVVTWNNLWDCCPDHKPSGSDKFISVSATTPIEKSGEGAGGKALKAMQSSFTWESLPLWLVIPALGAVAINGDPSPKGDASEPPSANERIIVPVKYTNAYVVRSAADRTIVSFPAFERNEKAPTVGAGYGVYPQRLVTALGVCTGADVQQPVIEVVGYADSKLSEKKNGSGMEQNVMLANNRAENLALAFVGAGGERVRRGCDPKVGGTEVLICVKTWPVSDEGHEKMLAESTYQDVFGNNPSEAAGALMRRVDAILVGVGKCKQEAVEGAVFSR